MNNLFKVLIFLFIIPVFVFADFEQSKYKYYKDIAVSGEGTVSVKIDDEVYASASDFLYDLRVVAGKKEIPYKINVKKDIKTKEYYLDDLNVISKKDGVYIIDMGEKKVFNNSIVLDSPSTNFTRVVDVYGSHLEDSRYSKININPKGEVITSFVGNVDLNINYKYGNYRYIKLVFDGDGGELLVRGFKVRKDRSSVEEAEKVLYDLSFDKTNIYDENFKDSDEVYFLEMPIENIPLDFIKFEFKEDEYARSATLYGSDDLNALVYKNSKRYDDKEAYWARISNFRLLKSSYLDAVDFNIDENSKYYLLVVHNDDNEFLNLKRVTGQRYIEEILFNTKAESVRLYYSGDGMERPVYDVSAISSLVNESVLLGGQKENDEYVKNKMDFNKESYLFYGFILFITLIMAWFIYKIIQETKNKDDDPQDKVQKL